MVTARNEAAAMKHAILSYGLGVDSTALLLRRIFEPDVRPCALRNITVIIAMTGDEFENTANDVTRRILAREKQSAVRESCALSRLQLPLDVLNRRSIFLALQPFHLRPAV